MNLKLENILSKNIFKQVLKEEINSGDYFKDYIPVYLLAEPVETQFKYSDFGDEVNAGPLVLSEKDVDDIISTGKLLNLYTFMLETKEGELKFTIDGRQINDPTYEGAVLVKNRPYTINLISGKEPKRIDAQSVNLDKKSLDNLNSDFSELKKTASSLKSMKLSQYADNPNFRKALMLNLINSKLTNIKINGEPISKTLIKLNNNGLLEAPNPRDINKKQQLPQGWENLVSKFFTEVFKLFATLHKCCSDTETYIEVKKFFKLLFLIVKEGKSNYGDQQKIDKLFKQFAGNMGNLINSIVRKPEFVAGKSGKPSDEEIEKRRAAKERGRKMMDKNIDNNVTSFKDFDSDLQTSEYNRLGFVIKEENGKKQIIFIDFNISTEDIEDSFDNFTDEYELNDDDGEFKGDLDPEDIKRIGFNLYGKDAGRLFPNLSFKYKDIKTLFGLLGSGGLETATNKIKDRYGIYDMSWAESGGGASSKTMKNLPKYILEFDLDVNFRDKDKNFVKFKKGDRVIFNYDKDNRILIHKISAKKYANVSQVIIEMNLKPEIGKTYDSKIIKIIPLKGNIIESQPNYKVRFTIKDPKQEGGEENKK